MIRAEDAARVQTKNVHPTAVVHPSAHLGRGVEIGPYCLVGEHVKIGDGSRLLANVVVLGHTEIGSDNVIYPFAVLGGTSQDKKFRGEVSYVRIGDRNTIREYVTVNRGTDADSDTTVGSDCLLLAYTHVAHDCRIGSGVVMSNLTQLAGHCLVGDGANLGGMVGVHQFVRIGRMAFVGGRSKILKDCPPFMLIEGNPAHVRGLNRVGLRRQNVSTEAQAELKDAYRMLYMSGETLTAVVERLRSSLRTDEGRELVAFFESGSDRGFTTNTGRRGSRSREAVLEDDSGAA